MESAILMNNSFEDMPEEEKLRSRIGLGNFGLKHALNSSLDNEELAEVVQLPVLDSDQEE